MSTLELLAEALDIALRQSSIVYDACYVALASRLGKSFITTGERLARPDAGTPH